MPTPKVRQTPQSRVEKIFREQGFGLVLGLFAVVLAFVFVPVFVVDDPSLRAHGRCAGSRGSGRRGAAAGGLTTRPRAPATITSNGFFIGASEAGRVNFTWPRHRAPLAPSCRIAGRRRRPRNAPEAQLGRRQFTPERFVASRRRASRGPRGRALRGARRGSPHAASGRGAAPAAP